LTTGIIWVQVRKFERFGACFYTCALIIWSVLLHPRCEAQVERHGFHQTYHRLRKSLWTHPMELLRGTSHVEPRFGLFGDGVSVDAR
jgi:hypothetical protein